MRRRLREKIMYYGYIGLTNTPNIIEIKKEKYQIDDEMKKLIRIKNGILVLELVIGTLIYKYLLAKNYSLLVENSLATSLIFIGSISFLFYITPRFIIPKNLSAYKINRIK